MAIKEYTHLTPAQRAQFLESGWVKIENGVSEENLRRFSHDAWARLGFDPEDKSTWVDEKIHLPRHRQIPTKDYAPKVWGAICEICGGKDRIDLSVFDSCGDSLIVNLGSEKWVDKDIPPSELGNWHIDGDWFRHFLDSGEQALTIIILFNDIVPKAGGTYVAPDGIKNVCEWLYNHPEGSDGFDVDETGSRVVCGIKKCSDFVELTGKRGDAIIFHPFMPHSASKNHLRIPRFITNPPVSLKEPLRLDRENPDDYSLLELKILQSLQSLGLSSGTRLDGWKITRERKKFEPRTRKGKDVRILEELGRMRNYTARKLGFGGFTGLTREQREEVDKEVDSMHVNGVVPYLVVPVN